MNRSKSSLGTSAPVVRHAAPTFKLAYLSKEVRSLHQTAVRGLARRDVAVISKRTLWHV